MKKIYLKNGDRAYTTGSYLIWNDREKSFEFDGMEEDTFFDGKLINFDDMDRPYIVKK
jgi:hypothetical protein